MLGIILRLVITVVGLVVAKYLGLLDFDNWTSAALFALVLGVLNAVLKPVLVLLTLPLTLLTLGLFTLVINGILFWLAAQFPLGVQVSSFTNAFLAALIVSVVSFVLSRAVP